MISTKKFQTVHTDARAKPRKKTTEKNNPGFIQGIRVGNVNDGKVTAFIPETKELSALEGVAADDAGNIYGGYTNTPNFTKGGPPEVNFRRWVKKGPGL